MQRFWCSALGAAAFSIATAGSVSAATLVSIESAAPGSAHSAAPAVVFVHALPVPLAGATITIDGHAAGLAQPAKLGTAVIVGSRRLPGSRDRSFRSIVAAPASVLNALARDPHATVTLTVCPTGHPEAATTAGPFAVSFVQRSEKN